MKIKTTALMLTALLLGGCSTTAQKKIATCSMDLMGITMNVKIEAPSEEADVDKLSMEMVIPLSTAKLMGLDTSDKDALEKEAEAAFGANVNTDNTTISVDDENVTMTYVAQGSDLDSMGGSDSRKFKDVVASFEQASGLTCE